jgi:hypothetical protein
MPELAKMASPPKLINIKVLFVKIFEFLLPINSKRKKKLENKRGENTPNKSNGSMLIWSVSRNNK